MILLNNNVLAIREKTINKTGLDLSDSELKETAVAKVVAVDNSTKGWCSVGDSICVYKYSGILVDGLEEGSFIVPSKDILFKWSGETIIMNGSRLLVERQKVESENFDFIVESEVEKTIGIVLASEMENIPTGSKVCFGANSGVEILLPDDSVKMVFDASEILFIFN